MTKACAMCHGTDVADQCARGQCYFDEQERHREEEEQERREWENAEMARHYSKHPHG